MESAIDSWSICRILLEPQWLQLHHVNLFGRNGSPEMISNMRFHAYVGKDKETGSLRRKVFGDEHFRPRSDARGSPEEHRKSNRSSSGHIEAESKEENS